jgi:hypothetical protein
MIVGVELVSRQLTRECPLMYNLCQWSDDCDERIPDIAADKDYVSRMPVSKRATHCKRGWNAVSRSTQRRRHATDAK